MNAAPAKYAVRVEGHLDDHWSAWLAEMDMTRNADGTTTVTVSVADQAQLHGVLAGLRDIGAVLIEFRATGAPAALLRSVLDRRLHTEPVAQIIGDFMLRREDAWAQLDVVDQARNTQAELGWVLDPAYTRQGYATEAVRELLRCCFQDLGVRRVTANCFLDNDASWRLMERVGMRREAHAVRDSLHRSGRWLDTVAYAMLEDDWSRDHESRAPGAPRRYPLAGI